MFIGKIIGTLWVTMKHKNLEGYKLQVIQPLNSRGKEVGSPIVAVDTVGARCGDVVMYVTSHEAVIPMGVEAAVDASIVGIIEEFNLPDLSN